MVGRLTRNQEVVGSIPTVSSPPDEVPWRGNGFVFRLGGSIPTFGSIFKIPSSIHKVCYNAYMNYDSHYQRHLAEGRTTQAKLREQKILKYMADPNQCKNCSEPLAYSKRKNSYCSRSCAVTMNNKGVNRHATKCKKGVSRHGMECKKDCLECGASIKSPNSKKKFCSGSCSSIYRKKQKWAKMLQEQDLSAYPHRSIRDFILHRDQNKCAICGTADWRGQPAPLIMDHIDGNSYNNSQSNLRAVCAMCDAQLPTYKGRNLGNGRHKRRERYKAGLSY